MAKTNAFDAALPYLAADELRKFFRELHEVLQEERSTRHRLDAAKAGASAESLGTPAGAASYRSFLQNRQQESLANEQLRAAQLQAEAAHAATPAGQSQLAGQARARQQQQAAQQAIAHQQNIAQYGQTAAELMRFGKELRGAAVMVAPFAAGALGLAHVAVSLGSKANPMAGGTFRGSAQLAEAETGSVFTPLVDRESRRFQAAAQRASQNRDAIRQAGEVLADYSDLLRAGSSLSPVAMWHAAGGMAGRAAGRPAGNTPPPPLQSLEGMPEARMTNYGDYWSQLQMSAAQTDPLQTETLRTQMRNMQERQNNMPPEQRILLESIAGSTERMANELARMDNPFR